MLFMLVLYLASLVLFDRVFYVFLLRNKKRGSATKSLSVASNSKLCSLYFYMYFLVKSVGL